ncbi:hypothetical protein RCL1_003928 [Eukaryota sp. TZLM3-RCL]
MTDIDKKASLLNQILLTESAGYLEAEGVEQTFKYSQSEIVKHVDHQTQSKIFNIPLTQPHKASFDRNGKFLLLTGSEGHCSMLDWKTRHSVVDFNFVDQCYDSVFLHNHSLYATAQSKGAYIYDQKGIEIHALKNHNNPRHLTYLPHHFLLVSGGLSCRITWQDVSTGDVVAAFPTRVGPCKSLSHSPTTGLVYHGDSKGVVSIWTPNTPTPVVQMLAHKGAIVSSTVDITGNYLITAGHDKLFKVFDIRTFSPLFTYNLTSNCNSLDISQNGILAIGQGTKVRMWKDVTVSRQQSPYLVHTCNSVVNSVKFCPFEDVLGVGTGSGYSSILVPGAGIANIDSSAGNPYETKKQKRENEVRKLLEKIPSDLIVFDRNVGLGSVGVTEKERVKNFVSLRENAGLITKKTDEEREKKKTKGRSSALNRLIKKKRNVYDAKREEYRAELQKLERNKDQRIASEGPKSYLNKFTKYNRKPN